MPIKTAKDGYVDPGKPDPGARSVIDRARSLRYPVSEPTAGDPTGLPVMARVDYGRWIGDCNGLDPRTELRCPNAQFVHPDDHRFFCVVCFNYANEGRWRPVTWPVNKDEIEQSLEGLSPPEQSWSPVYQQSNRFITTTATSPEDASLDLRASTTSAMVIGDPAAVTLAAPIDSEGIVHITRDGQHVSSHSYLQDSEVRRLPADWFESGDEVMVERLLTHKRTES